jgi:heterodisulfide reductase subunit B
VQAAYLYFPGCKLTPFLPQYDRATRAVLRAFDIHLDDIELNCCGYPIRHRNLTASVLAAARNLAIADRMQLPLLTPCQCCYGSLKQAAYWLDQKTDLRTFVNHELADEGLQWRPGIPVRHLLSVLVEDIGLAGVRERIRRPLEALPVAAHYGCHALRPGHVVQLDNPLAPTIFENLLSAAGAAPLAWPLRLECCGHPVRNKNPKLAGELMRNKCEDARAAGARLIVTACTYCQMQFAGIYEEPRPVERRTGDLPTILVSQLLGWAMGLPDDRWGDETIALTALL